MIETRPDWCVSRQRVWGVPLPIFINKKNKKILIDDEVFDNIANIYEKEGSDCWFSDDPQKFLGNNYNSQDYEKLSDIVEVWFDSGSTHSFVLEKREDLKWPASMYLEGSDQHRGWFHSSLLESCGTRGVAPYESVLTHGFVLHEDGNKMSKSSSNIVPPAEIVEKSGADILRLWVASSDYSEDLKIGPEIIKSNADSYRRLRNTLRFILGNLNDFSEDEKVNFLDLPELDQYILHKLAYLEDEVLKSYQSFEYQRVFSAIFNFCTNELSSFYFDVRKDSLYCDHRTSLTRRATRTVLDILFNHLLKLLAPILCFTTEEAWQSRLGTSSSIHNQDFPSSNRDWINSDLSSKWDYLKSIRKNVNGAIEIERKNKVVGSSLEADVEINFLNEDEILKIDVKGLEDICIVSKLKIIHSKNLDKCFESSDLKGIGVKISKVTGSKCNRCWKYFEVLNDDGICQRCAEAIK